ncbi:Wzz/FepE/Etk N-terminal domain-containing protein [Chromobacterium vaccinii]|uniref:Wzz/FepE/Etk N-terminal domain-containing protein n=1 Tax=Chromobacterium vaccinii TaxID=1108595 RepID=UPI001E49B0B2|nr:Wzz/FepE/Etk N-terminal domain-containing protein [Chromobacterium vaccinii]MCD4486454.1 Wzz/FepE/Etk N-terminal domain-containing protein [Chromobacterium vaccinii]
MPFSVWIGECILERQSESDELSLFDIILVVKEQWRLLLMVPALFVVLAAAASLSLPNQYTAKTMLNIPAPVGAVGGMSIVQSPSLLEPVVEKYKLQQYYGVADKRGALLAFSSSLKTVVGKDGLLEISVTDRDPERAAVLGNALAEMTRKYILDSNLTEQSKRYVVLQEKLNGELEQADWFSRKVAQLVPDQEVLLGGAGTQVINGFATLEAQLALQMSLQSVQSAGGSTVVSNLQSAIMQLRASLESTDPKARQMSNEQLVALRNLYFHRALAAELQRQVVLAKSLAEQDVQVVLKASAPLEKSAPKRSLFVALAGTVGLMLSILIIVCRKQWKGLQGRLAGKSA